MSLQLITDPFNLSEFGVNESELPSRHAVKSVQTPKFIFGGELPHLASPGLWELPAAIGKNLKREEKLRIRIEGVAQSPLIRPIQFVNPQEAVSYVDKDQGSRTIGSEKGSSIFDSYYLFKAIQTHGDLLLRLADRVNSDPSVVSNQFAIWMPTRILLNEYVEECSSREPPISLIIQIQKRLHQILKELQGSLRMVLRRRRKLLPVAVAEHIDAGCIEWLARQPGRTLAERAGNKQEVLAVVREDTYDTFENRVLKECLTLCISEVNDYERIYGRNYPGAERVAQLTVFRRQLQNMLKMDQFQVIGEVGDDSRPNYVLQFDLRYKEIWWAYQSLIKRQKAQDELWRWRHRIWSEMLLLDVIASIRKLSGVDASYPDRELGILRDPQRGFWVHEVSRFPAFPVQHNGELFYVGIKMATNSVEPSGESNTEPCDFVVKIYSSRNELIHELMVTGIAEYLPILTMNDRPKTKLVIRPELSLDEEINHIEYLSSSGVCSGIISWPIMDNRLKCGEQLIRNILDNIQGGT